MERGLPDPPPLRRRNDTVPPGGASRPSLGRFGMLLFLAALTMLFAAGMVGYLVVRLRAEVWPPAGSPGLPGGLWISTVVLLASSATMHQALRSARAGEPMRARDWLVGTTLLGLVFLGSQIVGWRTLIATRFPAEAGLYAFTFYMLTGLHAVHVLGGLIPLVITTLRAGRRLYTETSHEGLVWLSMYWHFLDVVWIVIFVVLLTAG